MASAAARPMPESAKLTCETTGLSAANGPNVWLAIFPKLPNDRYPVPRSERQPPLCRYRRQSRRCSLLSQQTVFRVTFFLVAPVVISSSVKLSFRQSEATRNPSFFFPLNSVSSSKRPCRPTASGNRKSPRSPRSARHRSLVLVAGNPSGLPAPSLPRGTSRNSSPPRPPCPRRRAHAGALVPYVPAAHQTALPSARRIRDRRGRGRIERWPRYRSS